MAEQDVRPQQLSIRDIAQLWCAETGEDPRELEEVLSNWAYVEAVDRGHLDVADGGKDSAPAASTALKIEPDPARKLTWRDLEAFCRDNDRLVPHFWPEPADEIAEPTRTKVRVNEPRLTIWQIPVRY